MGDTYDATGRRAREHRKRKQTGSEALYFAKCSDPTEDMAAASREGVRKNSRRLRSHLGRLVRGSSGRYDGRRDDNPCIEQGAEEGQALEGASELQRRICVCSVGHRNRLGLFQAAVSLSDNAYSILKATEEVDEDGKKHRLVQIRYGTKKMTYPERTHT